ncbi:MAG: cohesin domain-containing protein [bacterium]|nr:cohesin domain-containing protein [bacterium]
MQQRYPSARSGPPLLLLGLMLLMLAGSVFAVSVTIPDRTMIRGNTIDIPIQVGSVTGLNVYAFDLQFTYTASAVTPVTLVTTGSMSAGWGSNVIMEGANGVVRISGAGSTALTGSGNLLFVRFEATLTGSGGCSFNWLTSGCRFNEGTPTLQLTGGYLNIDEPIQLSFFPSSGEVYVGDSMQVSIAGGTSPYTANSSDLVVGSYFLQDPTWGYFTGYTPGTTTLFAQDGAANTGESNQYIVRPLKLEIPDTTISSGEQLVLPVYLRMPVDVTPNAPTLSIALVPVPGGGYNPRLRWPQLPGVAYRLISYDSIGYFTKTTPGISEISYPYLMDFQPTDPTLFEWTDQQLVLPNIPKRYYRVYGRREAASQVYSGQFRISWNPNALSLNSVDRTGTLLAGWSFQSELHTSYVDVSFGNSTPLPGGGILFYLRFNTAIGYNVSAIDVSQQLFNESLFAVINNGSVTRLDPPILTITPGGPQQVIVGNPLQFEVSGGTSPYTWSLSNPAVGSVSNSGLFTPTQSGTTHVLSSDALGIPGSSDLISVYEFTVTPPTISVTAGDSLTIGLATGSTTTNAGIYGVEITVDAGTAFTWNYPVQSGTLTNDWSMAYEANGGVIRTSQSSANAMSGTGDLIRLRGRVTPGLANGWYPITITRILLNEGERQALVQTGYLIIP